MEEYTDEGLRKCCMHGLKPDRFLRTCSERVDAIKLHLDEQEPQISEDCLNAFEKCCYTAGYTYLRFIIEASRESCSKRNFITSLIFSTPQRAKRVRDQQSTVRTCLSMTSPISKAFFVRTSEKRGRLMR